MKKIYTLKTSLMNGTVTMQTVTSSFSTKELAEKTKNAVKEANASLPLLQSIEETTLYEDECEVPILN